VTPFAAGCAICGADLEAHRAARAQRRHVSVPAPSVRLPYDWWLYLGTAVAALMFPLLGLILAYFAGRDRSGGERTFFVTMGAIAVVLLVIPTLRFGVLRLVYG
jgi:purine-cytosine permease-like protein